MRKGICYYPWYKNYSLPIVGSGYWGSGSTNKPILGNYESSNIEIIDTHLRWIKEAGFDFIYINLTSIDGPEVSVITEKLIPKLNEKKLNFAFFIDSYQAVNKVNRSDFMFMDGIYDNLSSRDFQFNKILDWIYKKADENKNYEFIDGRPLIYIYIARSYKWTNKDNFSKTNIRLKKFYTVGDMIDWTTLNWKYKKFINTKNQLDKINLFFKLISSLQFFSSKNKVIRFNYEDFDLISWYNLAQPFVQDNLLLNINQLIHDLGVDPKKVAMTIMPGYNDSKLAVAGYPIIIERDSGNLLEKFFNKIPDYSPKLYNFVSFNEWHEGTEIEPSIEHGFEYLELAKKLNIKLNEKNSNRCLLSN